MIPLLLSLIIRFSRDFLVFSALEQRQHSFSCRVKGQKFFERDTVTPLSTHQHHGFKLQKDCNDLWDSQTHFYGSKVCLSFVRVSLNNNQSCMFIYYLIIYLFHLSFLCYHTMCPPFLRIQLFHFPGPFILDVLLCFLFFPSGL